MKKLISLSDNVNEMLVLHAKENNSTQSKVVEVAISLYLSMYKSANAIAQTLEVMKNDQPAAAVKKKRKSNLKFSGNQNSILTYY